MPVFSTILRIENPSLRKCSVWWSFLRVHHTGPTDSFPLRLGHRPDVVSPFQHLGAVHLSEQRQDNHR